MLPLSGMSRAPQLLPVFGLLVVLLPTHMGATDMDPCASMVGIKSVGRFIATKANAMKCLNSPAKSTAGATQTIDTLTNYLSMYSYIDILRNFSDPRLVPGFHSLLLYLAR